MHRDAWTDERLDDMAARGESQFELLRMDIRDMRAEMGAMRNELRGEMADMRSDFQTEMRAVRRDMFHGAIALFAALLAMYATMIVHIVA